MNKTVITFSLLLFSVGANAHGFSRSEALVILLIIFGPIALAVILSLVTLYRFVKKKSYKFFLITTVCLYIVAIVTFFTIS